MKPVSLTQAVKTEAQRIGFDLVGVTTPDAPLHFAIYQSWLKAGRHGEMAYLATQRAQDCRADPRCILPECQSILVLGVRCPPPGKMGQTAAEPELRGKVASYAWGADYHEVLPERLRSLVAFLEAQVGAPIPNRWYTDTGPLLERDLAQRAGLGWIGKNTCLIHPRLGSNFLLAEILLGLPLEPDPPFLPDMCGTCTRCLEACPTRCILPDRTLDARRCISYLTIELKGPIPEELRLQTGEWTFGCDICQQVCPWNLRFAASPQDEIFASRAGVPRPRLADELRLDPAAFNRKFKGSPVKRAKRRGYLRNSATALGNILRRAREDAPEALPSHFQAAIQALIHALTTDAEPLVRGHAAWALGQVGGAAAQQVLSQAAVKEIDPGVRREIHSALANLRRPGRE